MNETKQDEPVQKNYDESVIVQSFRIGIFYYGGMIVSGLSLIIGLLFPVAISLTTDLSFPSAVRIVFTEKVDPVAVLLIISFYLILLIGNIWSLGIADDKIVDLTTEEDEK